MSNYYASSHRALQDRHDARRMADLMENGLMHAELDDKEQGFIASRDMFFLSTVDPQGRPTVSYKGGAPGFVRVANPKTLMFPSYDGNGMFYSMGNLSQDPKVGLLFIDFETPHRLRVQGRAEVRFEDPALQAYPEAQFLVVVKIDEIWPNCPRYVHRYQRVESSKYVPEEGKPTPMPAWKRIDFAQDALPKRDQGRADEAGGTITKEQYGELVGKGEA